MGDGEKRNFFKGGQGQRKETTGFFGSFPTSFVGAHRPSTSCSSTVSHGLCLGLGLGLGLGVS